MARNFVAQRQIYATVSGVDGTFSQVSGGETSANSEKIYDGGSATPVVMSGARDIGNVTLVRAFDQDRDPDILDTLRDAVGREYFTIIVTMTDADMVPLRNRTYANALLIGMNEPEGDAASGAPASMSLVFSVGSVASAAATTASVSA